MIQEPEIIKDTSTEDIIEPEKPQEFKPSEEPKKPINIKDVHGILSTITTSASIKAINPRTFKQQFQIEDNGSTTNLWVYVSGNGWKKTSIS